MTSCNEQTRHIETKNPRPYFGDSLITLNFIQKSDTTYRTELETNKFSEMITYGKSGDTTFADLYTDLASGVYNGASEINGDTIILNYWLDSSDCVSAIVHSKLTYKILSKNIKQGYLQSNFIKTNSPIRKSCK